MSFVLECDVVVVGGGHAGTEAAAAAARLGVRTVLVTPDLDRLAQMSCNPAVGGIAKGVVVREVDALGGIMARATDATRIHWRMLNRSKGPAVWGPRAQCDRVRYPGAIRRALGELEHLHLFQDLVTGLVVEGDRATGVTTRSGGMIRASAVVVTAGTFLRGRIHLGRSTSVSGGRAGEAPSVELATELERCGVEVARFKTGTPPRIDGRSVNFDLLERQDGDPEPAGRRWRFSVWADEVIPAQRPCWITWTGADTQRVVEENLERSALYGGEIAGRGPRYCPSIEDKVVRFPDAPRHQVFLEPEGLETTELYVNGLSTSLPADAQLAMLRSVPGLEEVRITRLGYAIEYDWFPPHQLRHTLEVRAIPRLWFAGQINGTTGYEEAAGQGLVAGTNAALAVRGEGGWVLERDQAYIGVLIDDLVTRGVDEPYRLFTSRSEFRLLLRQDNAASRLAPLAREIGLLTPTQEAAFERHGAAIESARAWFAETPLAPERVNAVLDEAGTTPITEPTRALELLRRPHVSAEALAGVGEGGERLAADALATLDVDVKYEGYVERERARAAAVRAQARVTLSEDLPFAEMHTLSAEAREKLGRVQPTSLAQAARIPGVSPADLQNLLMEVRRRKSTAGRAAAIL
ncbi:MAG: tRNA uridine-5-carboxymethylaminomethyl(34) synthesis enzyme MnmG [Longimicrobiales bacterium]|nr:tRNA uridine-5-carboxymethylaminomethyl(34) synthesis enzyme MnmG [Longimicrobiales bacterium]